MGLFSRARAHRDSPSSAAGDGGTRDARPGFSYLDTGEVYLDSACQTLRPDPVLDAMGEYYRDYGACGGRVRYDWGRRVDEGVAHARAATLRMLGLSPRRYACAFTLNTTYGLNMLLQQLPARRYARVVTTHTEHNAVFLSTMSYARRAGIPRVVLDRAPDGALLAPDEVLRDALVVVSAMDNVEGSPIVGLSSLTADVQRLGGTVIVDAAQAVAHSPDLVRGLTADAICFSAHKLYGPSLGVVVTTHDLLQSLDVSFLGGGQVAEVSETDFTLLPESHTRLEPGLQAWAEIIGHGAALDWLPTFRSAAGETLPQHEGRLSTALHDGLSGMPNLEVLSPRGSSLVTVRPDRVDAHRLATFLAKADVSVRSGYFCAHHWLKERRALPPLVRFSIGAHNTDADVDRALTVLGPMIAGL